MQSQQHTKEKKNPFSLHFMPGAGGNFFCRMLNFHPEINWHEDCINSTYQQKYEILNYQAVINRRTPLNPIGLNLKASMDFKDTGQNLSLIYQIVSTIRMRTHVVISALQTTVKKNGIGPGDNSCGKTARSV